MRKSRFNEEQMVTVLREEYKTSVAEAADVKRLKTLENEYGRLNNLLAERGLNIKVLKEINAKKW